MHFLRLKLPFTVFKNEKTESFQKNTDETNPEYFYRLTPEVVLNSMEEGGFHPSGHCRALNSLENRVFDIGLDDGSHLIAKFYRPGRWSKEQIGEEHSFLFELQKAEIPVIAPVRFQDGSTISSTHNIFYALWPLAGGREPAEFSNEELEITGRLLARIHAVGASGKNLYRQIINEETLGIKPLEFLIQNNFIPEQLQTAYRDAVLNISDIYRELAKDVPTQRIHGDCHIGNLLYGLHGWYFLDFDDCATGPAVQDIWMISSGREKEDLFRQQIFLDAYRTFFEFDDQWLSLVEPLRALRYIHYSAWIARRWKDPAFPLAFPHFGAEDYWQKELVDLNDQLQIIRKAVPSVQFVIQNDFKNSESSPSKENEELTNADFFWDMK